MSPATVDVTSQGAYVYFTAHITDDDSGVSQTQSQVSLDSPSGTSYSCANCSFKLQSGTDNDGIFQAEAYLPAGVAPGQYTVFMTLFDNAGNEKIWSSSDLQASGYPYEVAVTNATGDVTPPAVAGVDVVTPSVDVSGGDGVFEVQIHLTDDKSGVQNLGVYGDTPEGTSGGYYDVGNPTLVSGTNIDGWWDVKLGLPQHTPGGTWTFGVYVWDNAANHASYDSSQLEADGYANSFSVNSPEADTEAPKLVSFSMTPSAVDVENTDQTVTIQMHVTDNMTGVDASYSQMAIQSVIEHQYDFPHQAFQLVSGTATDGVYQTTMTIPRASETGAWPIGVSVRDKVANAANYGMWGQSLVTIGAVPVEVVYNIPLPPLNVQAIAGDAEALVRWQPADDRGSPVTSYTVTESPQGVTETVDGSKTSVTMAGLRNGVEHQFVVTAVNAAGPSNPSLPANATPTTAGYWIAGDDGSVRRFGQVPDFGSASGLNLVAPVVGMAAAPGDQGYWLVTSDGGVFSYGPGARFFGSTGAVHLSKPIVGVAADPATGGYWLVASDGGVFAFNAPFYGSTGGIHLNKPIVGIAAAPDGAGYWLVASDGGVFSFGPGAKFYGSTGAVHLSKPIVGVAADPATGGYWLVASDGGIFAFNAPFYGSTGGIPLAQPIVGMAAPAPGRGYWLVARDGGVFGFGPDAGFFGSGAGSEGRVVGLAS
jgi:hypothetical protein